ncbi:MAG: OsmC family protein [Verrucomicrobiota bacterium]
MVEINAVYEGTLRCSAIHGPSASTLETDAPVDNHGKGERFSPTDLVATASGACLMTIMGIYAQRNDLNLDGTRVRVEKHMTQNPPRRIARLTTLVTVPLPEDHPHRSAIERAALNCPVHLSLHPDIEKPVVFSWEG